MKTISKTLVLLLAVVLLSTTLYGLVKVDSLALSPYGNFIIPAGSIVEILMINAPSCLVKYDGQIGIIPCENMYFTGRWGNPNRSPSPHSPSPRLQ